MLNLKSNISWISLHQLTIKNLLIVLILVSYSAKGSIELHKEKLMENSTAVRFDGVAFSGIKSAYDDFFSMGYDINNYTVDILISNQIKVVFTPKFHPDEGLVLGGKTRHGREVSYVVDLTTLKIINRTFAR